MLDSPIENVTRDESYLHPLFLERFNKFREFASERFIDIMPTCTWRSEDVQDFVFQFSRTIPGTMLTQDKGNVCGLCLADKEGNPLSIQMDYCVTLAGKVPMDFRKMSYIRYNIKQFGLYIGTMHNSTSMYIDINEVIEHNKTHQIYHDEDLFRIKKHRDWLRQPYKDRQNTKDSYLS